MAKPSLTSYINKNQICAVDTCERSAQYRGYCNAHYGRLRRSQPLNVAIKQFAIGKTQLERFESLTNKQPGLGPHGECWEWKASLGKNGYGRFTLNGSRQYAHRVAWYFANDKTWPSLYVLHSCDNRACVNPNHLREGTPLDNVQDCIERERNARGVRCGSAKLTEDQVLHIIRTRGVIPHTETARQLGVGPQCIRLIRMGRQWQHLQK